MPWPDWPAAGEPEEAITYVLIDCPPSLNLLTLNAMVAAHAVLVPVQCEFFALEGISQLKENIEQIKATLNPGLEIQGVVLTMHDQRTALSREVAQNVRAFFGAKVYDTIPRNAREAHPTASRFCLRRTVPAARHTCGRCGDY